jgi:MFS family permease
MLNYMSKDESTFKILFIYCACNFLVGLILSFFLRKLDYSVFETKELELKKRSGSYWSHTRQILSRKMFWRLSLLVFLVLTIKIIFYQQTVMLPLYMERDLGDDSHYGLMVVLNQLIVIITMPLFNYLNYFLLPYDFFIYGGCIAILSLVPFLFGASYCSVILFIVISSIGEGLYGPKLLEYSLEISPKGQEGVVIALTSVPSTVSSIFAGIIGGILLNSYCPDDGERKCWMAWSVIGLIAIAGILVLFSMRKWIEEPRFEAQPYVPCFKESLAD